MCIRDRIHLDHAAVNDKHDTDGKGVHGKPHEKGLEPQPEQFSRAQGFKLRLHIRDDAADINGGIPNDDARAAVHNALPHIEDTHDDIPCVRHNKNGTESLEQRTGSESLSELRCAGMVERNRY